MKLPYERDPYADDGRLCWNNTTTDPVPDPRIPERSIFPADDGRSMVCARISVMSLDGLRLSTVYHRGDHLPRFQRFGFAEYLRDDHVSPWKRGVWGCDSQPIFGTNRQFLEFSGDLTPPTKVTP